MEELALTNSIVSNKGFIRQMSGGGTKLNPTHVALWGGMLSTGQFVGVGLLQLIADKIGRKNAMHITWLSLVVVRLEHRPLHMIVANPKTSPWRSRRQPRTGSTGFLPDWWEELASA